MLPKTYKTMAFYDTLVKECVSTKMLIHWRANKKFIPKNLNQIRSRSSSCIFSECFCLGSVDSYWERYIRGLITSVSSLDPRRSKQNIGNIVSANSPPPREGRAKASNLTNMQVKGHYCVLTLTWVKDEKDALICKIWSVNMGRIR